MNKKNVCPLIVRTVSGSLSNLINFSVTKYLSLTLIAVINNISPPLTVALCYFILKEKVPCFEIVMLSITVAGILVYAIAGSLPDNEDEPSSADDAN